MQSHRIRSRRSALRVLVGLLFALGMLAGATATAIAAPAPHAASAHHAVSARVNATTSAFLAYPLSDFRGNPTNINGCGSHNLPARIGSYQWTARGQSGDMYNCLNEACHVNFVLPSDQNASQSTGVGWKSMLIVC
jgi:hypothetical protein